MKSLSSWIREDLTHSSYPLTSPGTTLDVSATVPTSNSVGASNATISPAISENILACKRTLGVSVFVIQGVIKTVGKLALVNHNGASTTKGEHASVARVNSPNNLWNTLAISMILPSLDPQQ